MRAVVEARATQCNVMRTQIVYLEQSLSTEKYHNHQLQACECARCRESQSGACAVAADKSHPFGWQPRSA